MNAYIFDADIYCESCGEAICQRLTAEGFAPADPTDESSYDSSEFPKGPFDNGGGEADCPQHCGCGPDCLEAVEIDGHKVGAFLENDLTTDGVQYVEEALIEGGAVAEFWASEYRRLGYEIKGPECQETCQ